MKPHQIRLTLLVGMALIGSGVLLATSCSSPDSGTTTENESSADDRARESDSPQELKATERPEPAEEKNDQPEINVPQQLVSQPKEQTPTKQKVREPIFEGWSKPTVALFITGRQHGYIEPCGCTGLENQKGGLARRQTLMRQLEQKGWPLVAVDVGNQVRRFGRQPIIKFEKTMEGLSAMNYAAIGLGPDDLRLPSLDLLRIFATVFPDLPAPIVSANVAIDSIDETIMPAFQIIEAGGKKIGVTAVLGKSKQKKLAGTADGWKSPAEGLKEFWPKLKHEACDLYVLLAHASLDETRELVQKFPGFDIVVTAGGAGEPTLEPETIENTKTKMVQVGTKGMYVGVVGFFEGEGKPIRYQRVPLDDRFSDSKDMLELLSSYQQQLETLGLDGLGLEPQPHPSGRTFVGSEACKDCHEGAYEIWKNGLGDFPGYHAHATQSIVKPPNDRSEIPRHHDPECISCHVTGWNPQKYYPYTSGYLDLTKDVRLHGNGCENCHGPGSEHIVEETAETISRSTKEQCLQCHDLDNSPDFRFETYWPRIQHTGLD